MRTSDRAGITSSATSRSPEISSGGDQLLYIFPSGKKPQFHLRERWGYRLRELWDSRELLYFLVWRDVKVKYKQSALGIAWVILQSLTAMVIFSIIFGRLAKLPSGGIPYPIFSYAALLPWTLFSGGLTRATASVVASAGVLKKVYFPRVFLPLASTLTGLTDFGVSLAVLVGMMLYYGYNPKVTIFVLPCLALLTVAAAFGGGLWLSAMNAYYRDIGFAVPFLVQILLYASPVVYSSSLVPEQWRLVYALNPMVGVIEGFRWVLFGAGEAPWSFLLVSSISTLFLLVSGTYVFQRMEGAIGDVV